MNKAYLILWTVLLGISCSQQNQQSQNFSADKMIIRIAEIEIEPEYLNDYLSKLEEESRASVELEPGVISIFPMYAKEKPTEIRIVEIYADQAAYQSHLQTPHFLHYKTTTLKMVKSLNLVDMNAIDEATMPAIFKKME
jgi:quinol monooxygenase YgiN